VTINSPQVRDIDITAAARPWRFARLASFFMVILCGQASVTIILAWIKSRGSPNPWLDLFVFFALILNMFVGWSLIAVISLRRHRLAVLSLTLLSIIGLFFLVVAFALVQPAILLDGSLYFAGGIIGIVAFIRIRRSKIPDLRMSFTEFIRESERFQSIQRLQRRLPPKQPVRGILTGIGGVGGLFVATEFAQSGIGFYLYLGAWYLLLIARASFQPSFYQINALDKRKPIVLFRSFEDDFHPKEIRNLAWALIDFSLEARLANYFYNFGPFIAVGTSNDNTPFSLRMGAARVELPVNDWESTVLGWMKIADTIVVFPGETPGILWELNAAITGDRVERLLLIFPRRHKWWWLRGARIQDCDNRLQSAKKAFISTRWSEAINQVDRPLSIRAIIFDNSGDVIVVRSEAQNRDSYHLGTMVAHFLQLKALETLPAAAGASDQSSADSGLPTPADTRVTRGGRSRDGRVCRELTNGMIEEKASFDFVRGNAYHEAGRAVVAWALGLRVDSITIQGDRPSENATMARVERLSLIDQIAATAAGREAELLFGHVLPESTTCGDRDRIIGLLLASGVPEVSIPTCPQLTAGEKRVRALLTKHERKIHDVAARLVECRFITGDEFKRFMDTAR